MARHRWATQATPDLVAQAPGQPPAGSVRTRMPRFRIAFGAAVVCVAVLGSGTVVMYLQQPSAPIDAVQLQPRGEAGTPGPSGSPPFPKGTASSGQAQAGNGAGAGPENSQDGPAAAAVIVHVAGAVGKPGVVELSQGSRTFEAIEKAGGALPDAALAEINLAEVLADGEQLYVPRAGEEARRPPAGAQGPGSVPAPGSAPGPGAGAGTGAGAVNINTATEAELQELPGVGPVLADRIVAWREEHGGFTTVADLDAVSGIGEVMMSSLAGLVTL